MKKLFQSRRLLFFLASFSISFASLCQPFELSGDWKYSTIDRPEFSGSDFNDDDWKDKASNALNFNKEELGGAVGFAWIRKELVLPATLNTTLDKSGALAIFLGRISQSDEFYLNGKLMGATGSSDIKRAYVINPDDIRWDSINVFALRIRHWGDKGGLQLKSTPYIDVATPHQIFLLHTLAKGVHNKQQVRSVAAEYILKVTNRSSKNSDAEVVASFFNFKKTLVKKVSKSVVLRPGDNNVSFPYTSNANFLKIVYTLTLPAVGFSTTFNDQYGYEIVNYSPASFLLANKIKDKFIPASFEQQEIKGWLGNRLGINNEKRLYQVDEAGILAGYINKPGSHAWIGEHVGKFIDAAANTYSNTKDEKLKIQLDRTVQHLIAAQLPDGYMGTYSPENHWTSWDVWSHKYSIIGLLNYYAVSGFTPALESAKKAGDLLGATFGKEPGQKDIITAGAHVGMAATSVLEPMVDLYRYTGNKKYLDFCYYIIETYNQQNGPKILATLNATNGRTDKTANAKAYEMLTNFVGIVKLYKLTGNELFFKPMQLAWNDIVASRLYVTGTASSFEHFKDDHDLPATDKDNMGEGCVTTTWMQFNYHLFCITGEIKYLNELERSAYNHLTGAENPVDGCVSYYTPLQGVKPYRCVITCCMSSVPRGISMIPLFANGKWNNAPAFLLYQPGTYSTTISNKSKVSFTTNTTFPADGKVEIVVNSGAAIAYPIAFRKPYWAKDYIIKINGKQQQFAGDEIGTINRVWSKGDLISIQFDMPVLVLDGGKSYPGHVALQRGPQVLAFDSMLNEVGAAETAIPTGNFVLQPSTTGLPAGWVGQAAFSVSARQNKKETTILLVPYADASQTGGAISTWLKTEAE